MLSTLLTVCTIIFAVQRDELVATIQKMEEAKIKADEILRHIPDEGMQHNYKLIVVNHNLF